MTRLPAISGDECISALQKIGYRVSRINGSHAWLVCLGRPPIPVPKHDKLGKGILRKIIHMADISIEEFINLLKK
jgi:predicted RNA binding protein YcfA (HicA-like mRNA interferase family)